MDGMTQTAPQQARTPRDGGVFHKQLVALLPKLRVQALALTRNRAAAEDLVQDAVANALAAQDSFSPGTNFAAWMHRILRNRFISTLRKQRETTDIEDLPASAFAVSGAHDDRMVLKELSRAPAASCRPGWPGRSGPSGRRRGWSVPVSAPLAKRFWESRVP